MTDGITPERQRKARELLESALKREPAERSRFLDSSCGADHDLRREIEFLLASREMVSSGPVESRTFEVSASAAEKAARSVLFLPSGTRLGSYEILSRIGAGGMGEVYRARDRKLQRDVAIKVLTEALANDPEALERFEREALAVAALSHPNILSIFDFGREKQIVYAVTELLDGETLREKLKTGSIGEAVALDLGQQILQGLSAAHEKGIVHRDLKPENVFVTADGRVKILDFGLAKRNAAVSPGKETSAPTVSGHTTPGTVMGTLGYMSPEQLLGLPVDQRSDLFSFGIVFYELLTGNSPFQGRSAVAIADAILHSPPGSFANAPVSEKTKRVVRRLLEKEAGKRLSTAPEVLKELESSRIAIDPRRRRLARAGQIAIATAVVIGAPVGVWLWRSGSKERWARMVATPEIARLMDSGKNAEAAALAGRARRILPNDPTVEKLWMKATGEASVESTPPGAEVYIRPYGGDPNAWERVGSTPLKKIRVPGSPAIWRVSKPGFATGYMLDEPPVDQTWKLRSEGSVPPEMVLVSGDEAPIPYPFVESPRARVPDFLIDRHEVTNEEFKKFVDAGGYQEKRYWKEPLVRDGRSITWESAVSFFRDTTGRPGPATWEAGTFPAGRERYPVAGVSWFEAAAYAEFAHKSLPTAYHWIIASENRFFAPQIVPGSNFRGAGTQPVESPGTLSGFGTSDMAGNVKEWCWNETRDGKRITYGGGFGEPVYMFTQPHAQSPWDRRPNFGFRCVRLDSAVSAVATAVLDPVVIDFESQKPVSDEVFESFKGLFGYDKGDLQARVEEVRTTPDWTYEKVSFAAAYGSDRVPAHLFLPKNVRPPYQTVVYVPEGGALFSSSFVERDFFEGLLDFFPKSGRAVLFPIYKSTFERKDDYKPNSGFKHPAMFRDHMFIWSKDLGRSIDYLETRPDIDRTKLAFFGFSWGAGLAPVLLAVDDRFRAAILLSGGFWVAHRLPQADPVNYVARVKIPVLMLNERYDTYFPLEASQLPLFRLLGTPPHDKRQVLYETGHANAPHREVVRESLDWLDKYLGPVRR